VKNIGKPCAGEPQARFDEGGQGRTAGTGEPRLTKVTGTHIPSAESEPVFYSTHAQKPSYDDPKQRCPLEKQSYDHLKQRCPLEKQSYDHLKQRCPLEKPSYDHLKQRCPLEKPSYDDLKQRCPLEKPSYDHLKQRCPLEKQSYDDLKQRCPLAVKPRARTARCAWDDGTMGRWSPTDPEGQGGDRPGKA
jgi:hypothetical protein